MQDQAAFDSVRWGNNQLSFTVNSALPAPGNLTFMVPAAYGGKTVAGVTRDGASMSYTTRNIKGADYALGTVNAGVASSIVVTCRDQRE